MGKSRPWSISILGISENDDVMWKPAIMIHTKAWFTYNFYDDFEVILSTLALRALH